MEIVHSNFEISKFNKQFEDIKMLSKARKPSDIIQYNVNGKNVIVDTGLIDPIYTKGKNYINPYADDFNNPNQESPNRFAMISIVDKFKKRVLVNKEINNKRLFSMPLYPTKIVESYEHAAKRLCLENLGINVDSEKINKVTDSRITVGNKKNLFIRIFSVYSYKDQNKKYEDKDAIWYGNQKYYGKTGEPWNISNIEKMEETNRQYYNNFNCSNKNCFWVPIDNLAVYQDCEFCKLYKHIYFRIMADLY